MIMICAVACPLVYAHCNGCTLFGIVALGSLSNRAMSLIVRNSIHQEWEYNAVVTLVGEFQSEPRLYSALVNRQLPENEICRTLREREIRPTKAKPSRCAL